MTGEVTLLELTSGTILAERPSIAELKHRPAICNELASRIQKTCADLVGVKLGGAEHRIPFPTPTFGNVTKLRHRQPRRTVSHSVSDAKTKVEVRAALRGSWLYRLDSED